MMVTEVAIGIGLAGLAWLAYLGFDVVPFVLLGVLLFSLRYLVETRGNGTTRFQTVKSNNAKTHRQISRVTFDDIGGQETAKREFIEALDFMKNDSRVRRLGIRPLKGILLAGPPGTGKTLMAKAAASYTDSVFIAASGSQFIEMYAGVGAQRVRHLFQKARESALKKQKKSSIVFIDELEVLGGKRGRHSGHLEYDQTLNQLLVEMDGINVDDSVRVLVIGATNRPDLLDDALLRPGRFDRVVNVGLPDREGRLHILQIHARNKPLAHDADLNELAAATFGLSGAHLESVMNEAAINAMRAERSSITNEDLKEALDKVLIGEKLDRKLCQVERERIAYHETGHALVSELCRPGSVSVVTVSSRGNALGYTRQTPHDEQYMLTTRQILDQIKVCLAGALSEEMVFGEASTSSAADFTQVVELAKKLVFAGLSPLGVVSRTDLPGSVLHRAIQQVTSKQRQTVKLMLSTYRPLVEQVARQLIDSERLDGEAFREMLACFERTSQAAVPSVEHGACAS